MYMKPSRSAEWFQMVEIPVPDISSPKTQSVDLFCFSILICLMYSSVQSLVI